MPIGPALPPHLAHLSSANRASSSDTEESGPSVPRSTSPGQDIDEEDDDEDDYGPALPPHLAARRKLGPELPSAMPTTSAGPSRPPVIPGNGPARPAAPTPVQMSTAYDDDDSDDDEIGPKPVPSQFGGAGGEEDEARSVAQEFREREARWAKEREEANDPSKNKGKKMEREEWMLVPPSSGILSNVDPLRKRPSTFSRSTQETIIDNTVWTETPQEKAQRLADELAGVKRVKAYKPNSERAAAGPGEDRSGARKREREEELRREVERHTKSQRGDSLLNQHLARAAASGNDPDEHKPIWDHERDMGITGRLLTDEERGKKIKEAKGLNDRFGHGKSGAFSM